VKYEQVVLPEDSSAHNSNDQDSGESKDSVDINVIRNDDEDKIKEKPKKVNDKSPLLDKQNSNNGLLDTLKF